MRSVVAAVLMVIAFLGAACTTVPRAPSSQDAAPQSISQITETIRQAYNRGFERLAQRFRSNALTPLTPDCSSSRDFRQEWVRWAELKGSVLPGAGERTLARGLDGRRTAGS